MARKRMKYEAKFKIKVVEFPLETNNWESSRKFGVSEKLVRDWRKQVEKIKKPPKSKCADRGRKCQRPQLEDEPCLDGCLKAETLFML